MPADLVSTPKTSAPAAPANPGAAPGRPQDLEIKDAHIIFDHVWASLEAEYGIENLRFPREVTWLNGAPGAGKGTQTRFIMRLRELPEPPIVVSELLETPEARRLKAAGLMVGDKEVTNLVFRRLLDPLYQPGAVVDGYPRTKVQVECLKLLYQKLLEMRNAYLNTLLSNFFPKPNFHIIVLYIDEAEAVRRQTLRGLKAVQHNEFVRQSGVGQLYEVRPTDLSEEAARNRYRTFKEVTYESLRGLQKIFHYHYINAHGSVEEVQQRIIEELAYQSSLELDQGTLDLLAPIPIASQLIKHSRQELVQRLDAYAQRQPDLFKRILNLIEQKFVPIIRRHAMSGMALINSEDEVFEQSESLAMLIDVFSERGFHAVVDVNRLEVPDRIDPKTFKIISRPKRVYRFRVSFTGSEIRRGE